MVQVPLKPFRGRELREPGGSVAPPVGTVLVVAVTRVDAGTVIWHFSSSYSGDGDCAALTVNDGTSGWVSPDAVDTPDEMSIRGFYSGVTLNLSSTWQLLMQIDGVTFADGLLVVPQSGAIVA